MSSLTTARESAPAPLGGAVRPRSDRLTPRPGTAGRRGVQRGHLRYVRRRGRQAVRRDPVGDRGRACLAALAFTRYSVFVLFLLASGRALTCSAWSGPSAGNTATNSAAARPRPGLAAVDANHRRVGPVAACAVLQRAEAARIPAAHRPHRLRRRRRGQCHRRDSAGGGTARDRSDPVRGDDDVRGARADHQGPRLDAQSAVCRVREHVLPPRLHPVRDGCQGPRLGGQGRLPGPPVPSRSPTPSPATSPS